MGFCRYLFEVEFHLFAIFIKCFVVSAFVQVFLKDINSHRPQMERIVKRSKYLLLEANASSASDIRLGVESAQARWEKLCSRVESLVNRYSKLTDRAEKFEGLRQEVYSFLTETELKLIALDPYTSEEEPRVQLEKLKVRRLSERYNHIVSQ